jgi:hypothetical protein
MSYNLGLQVGEAAAGAAVVAGVRECRSIEAKQLAEKISIEQRAEIGQMDTLLRRGDRVCDGRTGSGASCRAVMRPWADTR